MIRDDTQAHTWPPSIRAMSLAFSACFSLILLATSQAVAQGPPAAELAPARIAALQQELAEGAKATSAVDARRAYKRVVRNAEDVLGLSANAPNRYAVLAIVFQAQKRLLSLESNDRNREAILETCQKLVNAPDEYAELRFEADMLLSQRELAERNATIEQRAESLEVLIKRYRGTPAEWQSLKIGSYITPKLLAFGLEQDIQDRIRDRFGGDHNAIEFRQQQTKSGNIDVIFSGKYDRVADEPLVFPNDRLGHPYLVLFWSKQHPEYRTFLDQVKTQADRFPNRFEIYSFNLDELPDAGRDILRSVGLNAVAMRLTGGKSNSAYTAYARKDPVALFVNALGHINLEPGRTVPWPGPTPARGDKPADPGPGMGQLLYDKRYCSQLRSLWTGDFLVTPPSASNTSLAGAGLGAVTRPQIAVELKAIADCFTPTPRRFRLSAEQSLAAYTKAQALCSAAIARHAQDPEVWAIRNRRIIALLGLWHLTGHATHLDAAVGEATQVLASKPPAGADIPARFCLAQKALRDPNVIPENLLATFIQDAGGDQAPACALAAAAVLALQANARTAYQGYRRQLLQTVEGDGEPMLWPVYAFLRDRHHQYLNFWTTPGGYGYGRPQKYYFRYEIAGLDKPFIGNRRLSFELNGMDGQPIRIPQVAQGKALGIVFVEPPADEEARDRVMGRARSFAEDFSREGVPVVVVMIAEDANAIRSLLEAYALEYPVGLLPDGLDHPVVRKLGILSADRLPNMVLLRPNGTIAWGISGLEYRTFGEITYGYHLAVASNIQKLEEDVPFDALEDGQYTEALELFAAYQPPDKHHDWWAADRLQGRALAHVGLKDWPTALTEIDAAINQRKNDFKGGICKCHGLVEMYLTKAMILKKLGQDDQAAAQRQLAAQQRLPHAKLPPGIARSGVPLGVYYDWLKQIRLKLVQPKPHD